MLRHVPAVAVLALTPPASAQGAFEPQPICSFFVMMNVAVHHLHCTAEDRVLHGELQTMLQRYAAFIARNGDLSEAEVVNSINTVVSIVDPTYDCARTGGFVDLHDAFAADPRRVQATTDVHLSVERPVTLDFDAECTDARTN